MRFVALAVAALMLVPTLALAVSAPRATPAPLPPPAPKVTIERDAYGVPHVYANDTYSLFFGNGYAMAQDRLFQMQVLRFVARGRGAELLGPSQLPLDVATRRDLYTEQERTQAFQALPSGQKLIFQAFSDGVNAWIDHTRKDPSKLSAEFYAIGHPPEDWIPEDTIAIAQFLLAIFGAGAGGDEFGNAQLLDHLLANMSSGEAQKTFDDLYWIHDNRSYSTIPADEATWPYAQDEPLTFDQIPAAQWAATWAAQNATPAGDVTCSVGAGLDPSSCAQLGEAPLAQAAVDSGMPLKWGSNGIVVSPKLSADGHAMLLGGPQMSYYNPMIPYEVALHGAGFDALGMGVGGAPGVIIGRTQHYSWTVTSGDGDQVDTVAERLVPGNPREYYNGTTGAITPMDCRTEIHYGPTTAVDPNPPVLATQEVCRTAEGPVFATNPGAGYAFVHQSAHRGDELRSGILWLLVSQAPDLAAFEQHMETFCFTFNFLQTDDSGNVAYNHWGCNPIHASGYDVRLPRVAGLWDWKGIRSGSQLPHVTNPEQGFLVNWNNLPEQGFSAGSAREQWGDIHRVQLIDQQIRARLAGNGGKISMDDLKAINVYVSTHSPFPPFLVPPLLDATASDADPTARAARAALQDWEACGYCWTDDHGGTEITRGASPASKYAYPAMAIYEDWRAHLQDDVMKDELGAFTREINFDPLTSDDPHAADAGRSDNKENVIYDAIMGRTQHDWCAPLSCAQQLAKTFDDTVHRLEQQYNTSDVGQWREPIHQDGFVALSGGPAWRIPMVNRPSFNHYYDWGTGEAGSVLPPGTNQSWDPVDFLAYEANGTLPGAHKRDQLDLYVAFQYKPAQMTPLGVESTTVLTAAPPLAGYGCQAGTTCFVLTPAGRVDVPPMVPTFPPVAPAPPPTP